MTDADAVTDAAAPIDAVAAVETVVAVALAADALAAEALDPQVTEPVEAQPVAAESIAVESVAVEPAPAHAAPPTRRSRRAARPVEPASVFLAQEQPAFETVTVARSEPGEELIFDAPESEPVANEPVAEEPVVEEPSPSEAGESASDAFEAAARLFSFTGETPIQAPRIEPDAMAAPSTPHVAPRRPRGATFKRITAASFSIGVMGVVGLLTVGMTTPAEAVTAPRSPDDTTNLTVAAGDVAPESGEIQAYVTPSDTQSAPIQRSQTYSTLTMAQLAADSGIANFSNFFVNDPNSPIQWPFAVGVPISYGFGMRDGTMHEGADFTPGEGSPIQAIADGVVRMSTDSGGAFGVHIVIDHVVDGELISSTYSHMLYGSRKVEVGDRVTVGQILGRTGNTGRSFGAHTHVELLANGTTPIDPISWLREHAGG